MNKRRRISKDGQSSPIKDPPMTTTPSRKPNLLPNYMTPTKASLSKSYPQLAQQQQQHLHIPSPIKQQHQPPRRSIPPVADPITEVLQVNNNGTNIRSFLDIANDNAEEDGIRGEPTGMAMNRNKRVSIETHLSSEEELERQKGVLMRRLRVLRAECDNLEQQLEQARVTRELTLATQKESQNNIDATMYSLPQLRSS